MSAPVLVIDGPVTTWLTASDGRVEVVEPLAAPQLRGQSIVAGAVPLFGAVPRPAAPPPPRGVCAGSGAGHVVGLVSIARIAQVQA